MIDQIYLEQQFDNSETLNDLDHLPIQLIC